MNKDEDKTKTKPKTKMKNEVKAKSNTKPQSKAKTKPKTELDEIKTEKKKPYKYDPAYHDAWAFSLAIKGATDEEIAEAFDVNIRTIFRWSVTKNDKGEEVLTSFGEARRSGKQQADAQVEKKLYDMCMGYDATEIEQVIIHGKNGEINIKETLKKTKHVPPNVMAIMYWLNNRSRKTGEWSQKQDVNVSFGDDSIREAVKELTLEEARAKLESIRNEKNEENK